jgi:hypothetical protein
MSIITIKPSLRTNAQNKMGITDFMTLGVGAVGNQNICFKSC